MPTAVIEHRFENLYKKLYKLFSSKILVENYFNPTEFRSN